MGAGATGGFAYLLERSRWRRELAKSSSDVRRTTYVRFFATLSRVEFESVMLARRLKGHPLPGGSVLDLETLEPGPARNTATRLDAERDVLTEVYEELRIVAPAPTAAAAKRCVTAVGQLGILARQCQGDQTNRFEEAKTALSTEAAALRERVRAELNAPA